MKYFIGIDGGGTRTRALVLSDTLEIVGRGEAGPSNHYHVGAPRAVEHCAQSVRGALLDARRIVPDLNPEHVAAWAFGLAGVRRDNDARMMPWALDTDAAAAHAGAFNGGSGLILSAGTGAICFAVDEEGERFYGDGWGPILGDEGSGYWMGQEALRAICRAQDGRAPRTPLTQSVMNALVLADISQLVPFVHHPETRPDKIAELARVVLASADAGVATAIDIRERAIEHLGLTAAATAHALLSRRRDRCAPEMAAPVDLPIALRGGLFEDDFFRATVGYNIGERMVEIKRDFLPVDGWRIVRPQFDASYGAALLAQRAWEKAQKKLL